MVEEFSVAAQFDERHGDAGGRTHEERIDPTDGGKEFPQPEEGDEDSDLPEFDENLVFPDAEQVLLMRRRDLFFFLLSFFHNFIPKL